MPQLRKIMTDIKCASIKGKDSLVAEAAAVLITKPNLLKFQRAQRHIHIARGNAPDRLCEEASHEPP
jgi:hypothetical protein